MTEVTKKKNPLSGFETALTIFVIIIAIIFWWFALYGPGFNFEKYNQSGDQLYSQADYQDINSTVIQINAKAGDFQFASIDPSDTENLALVHYDVSYIINKDFTNDVTIGITNTTINNTLYINITVAYEGFTIRLDDWNFVIAINPTLFQSLNITGITGTGDWDINFSYASIDYLNLNTGTGEIYGTISETNLNNGMTLNTDTGDIRLDIIECEINGDLSFRTNTGEIDITFQDIFTDNTVDLNFIFETDTGDIDVRWILETNLEGKIYTSLDSDTGEIDVIIDDTSKTTDYNVALDADIGDEDFNHKNWPIVAGFYQSDDFSQPTHDLLQITASTDVGDINIDIDLNG